MSALDELRHVFVDDFGNVLVKIHSRRDCMGAYCPIHNPSPAAQALGKLYWRDDRHFFERICEHGVGHPDPDDIFADPTHGCDGCCFEKGAK